MLPGNSLQLHCGGRKYGRCNHYKKALFVLVVLCASFSSSIQAEWLTLFRPQMSAMTPERPFKEEGFAAFSAFGCGECHSDLVENSYQSGFRVIKDFDQTDVDSHTGSDIQSQLQPPQSPIVSVINGVGDILHLDKRAYVRSGKYDAVYIRNIHSEIPGASRSLKRFYHASSVDQQAAVEYLLMF